jgi:hypothetical protein
MQVQMEDDARGKRITPVKFRNLFGRLPHNFVISHVPIQHNNLINGSK